MSYDDLPLGQTRPAPAAPPPEAAGSPTRWIVVGSAAILVVALLTFWWLNRAQPVPAPLAPTTATDVALGGNRPKTQDLALPPIDESDDAIRQLVLLLSQNPLVAKLVTTSGLARGVTLTIVQIGDGRTPSTPLKILRPATHVQIGGSQSGRIEPASYARWDSAAAALASINPKDAAQVYVNIQRLLDQAYHDQGYTDSFDDAFVRAIRMLADTPDLVEDPQLLRRDTYFEHDDPSLRALRPVQKQFLLMGPANRHKILEWLRALATNLDLKIS